jgi:netrin-G3 ligand
MNLTIPNLRPFTAYNITTLPFTIVGSGTPSPPLQLRTEQAAPSIAPSFQATAASSTSINVSWLEVGLPDANGLISQYSVIKADDSSVMCTTTELGCLITGLLPGTTRALQLVAATVSGPGPRSLPRTVRTLDATPSGLAMPQVSNVTGRAATLSWTSPTQPNGAIVKYEISAVTNQIESLIEVDGSTLEHRVTGLQPAAEYFFKLRAYTSLGPSDYSASAKATMLETGTIAVVCVQRS